MYDEAGPTFLVALGHQTMDRHRDGGTCKQCTAAGCERLAEAERTVTEYRAARAAARST